jgi:signal transduction histidine kinase
MKKYLIFCILICLFQSKAIGQNLLTAKKDFEKMDLKFADSIGVLNFLSRELTFIDSKKSMEYAQSALLLSEKYNYENGKANAYRNYSNIYVTNEIYFLGMDYLQTALNIFRNQSDSIGIANCYISLGHLYRRLQNTEDEIKYFKLAFDIFNRTGIQSRIGIAAHNLGESYYNSGDFENSKKLTLLAIDINTSIQQLSVLSSCYKVMGILEFSDKKYDEAEKYFQDALDISGRLGKNSQKIATVESMIHLSDIHKLKNNKRLQIEWLKQAAEFSKKNNLSSYLPGIYTKLILLYAEDNNQKMIKKYINDYQIVSDSLRDGKLKDKNDLVNNLISNHSLEKEKKFLEQRDLLQKESLKRRNILLFSTLILAILLIWFLIKIARINKRIKIANQTLITQNKTINDQNAKLYVLINTKDKLFSIIAHDLRSPFNSILGFSNLLMENINEFSKEQISHYVGYIHKNANSTLDLLEKLLEWAKNQVGQINFNPENIELNLLIKEIISSLDSAARLKNITLAYADIYEIRVNADVLMLRTIIRNLIQNSIKFTHPNGKVEIFTKIKNQIVEISVGDNGIGMSKETMDDLFFIGKINVKMGTSNEKGSGLGLILCKEFVEKHASTLVIESKEGLGSTFSFTIPLAKAD